MIEIIMSIIIIIESDGNPLAYNKKTGARGLCQITEVCLKDYNDHHQVKYNKEDLWNPEINIKIGNWYYNKRIPAMLKYYKIPDTVENRIIAYNWGIDNLKKWYKKGGDYNKLPKETQNYIRKYYKLLKEVR